MKTYALLIGINQYHPDSKVSPLSGCENDVRYMKRFLEERISKEQLFLKTLLSEEASYDNIIAHFGVAHLLKAEKGDQVFIHYSGHGAREKAAAAFKVYFPEEKQETLICYDSRLEGHYDLADKELAVLIERIANKGVQVVLTLDCCHSGSGTRGASDVQLGEARQWDDRDGERPLDSYLSGYFNNKIYVPNSKHILLAACEKREKAYELTSNRGSFTTHLLKVLEQSNGNISFVDLFAKTRILMRKVSDRQTPQFETYGLFNAYAHFLGFGLSSARPSYPVFFQDDQWQVEAGAIQSLPTTPDQQAVFEIYDNEQLLAHATTISVRLNVSVIEVNAPLDRGNIYSAKLISIPVPAIPVALEVEEMMKEEVEKIHQTYHPIYFELLHDAPFALYRLQVKNDQINIIRSSDDLTLWSFKDKGISIFKEVFKYLEHLCCWEKTLRLENTKALHRKEVELVLVELDDDRKIIRETKEAEIIIDILRQGGKEQKVPFRIEAHNHSNEAWNCALFYMSEYYGVYKMYNEEVPANSTVVMVEYTSNGKPYSFELNGKKEAMDIFKLIVSKEKINDYLLTQSPVKLGAQREKERSIGHEEEAEFRQESFNDWFAVSMKCKSIAQQ